MECTLTVGRYDTYVDDPNEATPLFPFGFGLSYTTFSYSELEVTVYPRRGSSVGHVSFRITNTGSRSGAEVAQVYLQDPTGVSVVVRPWKV